MKVLTQLCKLVCTYWMLNQLGDFLQVNDLYHIFLFCFIFQLIVNYFLVFKSKSK